MQKDTFKALYESLKEGVAILDNSKDYTSYTMQDIIEKLVTLAEKDSETMVIRKGTSYVFIGRLAQKLNDVLFDLDNDAIIYHKGKWDPLFEDPREVAEYQGGIDICDHTTEIYYGNGIKEKREKYTIVWTKDDYGESEENENNWWVGGIGGSIVSEKVIVDGEEKTYWRVM